jgi:hypothetical protein
MLFTHRPSLALAATAALLLLMGGCAQIPPSQGTRSEKACHAQDPEDLVRFPQTIKPYLVHLNERGTLMASQQRYKDNYYRVWADDYTPEALEKVKWPFDVYTSEDAYGENLRPLHPAWFYAMMREANWQAYNRAAKAAIALRRLNLRNFPTAKPLFHNPCTAGEGFPFDYLQNSSVFANEPLYLSHYSRSGAWAYVLTSYATGWVPSERIALIEEEQQRVWRERPLLALLEDRMPVQTSKNDYLFEGYVGMMLPLQMKTGGAFLADAAIEYGVRKSRRIQIPVTETSAAAVPMAFNRKNIQRVIAPMMQTKYGWGGLYGERDCSSTLRDIFAPFGLWLPRNSYKQSNVGRVVSFEGLGDEAKLAKIKSEAKPFETLLYLKGHILLYLGLYDKEPVVLHTVWGVKTVRDNGELGRHIVGKTVISSLRFGHELEGYSETYSLLHQLESMNFVFEEASK